nr:gdsl esterase/lipase [Quercus suber]
MIFVSEVHAVLYSLGSFSPAPLHHDQAIRLWLREDLLHVLINNTATEAIQAIILNSYGEERVQNYEAFPKALSKIFQPEKLVALTLWRSEIEYLWEGIKYLDKLKVIDLRYSRKLIWTPEFSGSLERLYLWGCINLVKIHPSIGKLRSQARANFPYNGIDFPHSRPTGRFSNGFNSADVLAKVMGCKKSPPPFLSCKQFIWSNDHSIKAMEKFLSKSLFFISIGSNDIFAYYHSNSSLSKQDFMSNLVLTYENHLKDLLNLGATKFGIISVPPIGCCPSHKIYNATAGVLRGVE